MKIYFLRHGETDYNLNGKIQGMIDIPLNETGISQAKEAYNRLKDIDFDAVYISGITRTRQTAEYALGRSSEDFIVEPRVLERNYAELEGEEYSVLFDGTYDYHRSYTDLEYTDFGVETLASMVERVESFIAELKTKPYENVLIVSHGGLGRVFYYVMTQVPFEDLVDFRLGNTQTLEFEV